MPLTLEIVTPEARVYSDTIDTVVIPTVQGEVGILPGHIPLLTQVQSGELRVTKGSETLFLAVSGGFAEVDAEKIIVLAEESIPLNELDAGKLDSRIKDAEEDVGAAKTEDDRAQAMAALDHLRQLRAAL